MNDTISCWLRAAARQPRLSSSELIILCRTIAAAQAGLASKRAGQRALDRIINANLRLIVDVMRKRFSWISLADPLAADCLQEGSIGLRTAALKFEPRRGYRFSTYANQWIVKEIGEFLRDRHRMIRVSADCHSVAYSARKLAAGAAARSGRPLELKEVATALGKPIETVRLYIEAFRSTQCSSANRPQNEDDGCELLQNLPDPHQAYDLNADQRGERLHQCLQTIFDALGLSGKEREIVCQRQLYAVPVTFQELGERYGVSGSAVRSLYHRLMERIRNRLQRSDVSLTHILSQA